jgi:hypothetical protein
MQLLTPSQALMRVKMQLPTECSSTSFESPYICDNIRDLWRQGKITDATKEILVRHISTILEGEFSLREWLISKGHATREDIKNDLGGAMLQYTRQNWLNDMTFYFKSKGM